MILTPDFNTEILIISEMSLMGIMWSLYKAFMSKYGELTIQFMDHSAVLNFQSDRYTAIDVGVMVRRYDWDEKTIIAAEIPLLGITNQYNPDEYVCLFFRIEAGASFPLHTHPGDEHSYLTQGKATITDDPELILTPEKSVTVPANTVHYFKAEEFCMGASFIQKT
jgi:quercetin dioxygenase-like cupin family protein